MLPRIIVPEHFRKQSQMDFIIKLKHFVEGAEEKFLVLAVSGLVSFTDGDSRDKSFSPEKILNN